jgi:tripartite-type tricarboxylate transporter receptor subunit TctC
VNDDGVAKYEAVIWLGMMAPAGTPEAVVSRLNAEINKIVNTPDVKAAWAKQGAVPMVMSPSVFSKYVADDVAKWATVVRVSGAKAD